MKDTSGAHSVQQLHKVVQFLKRFLLRLVASRIGETGHVVPQLCAPWRRFSVEGLASSLVNSRWDSESVVLTPRQFPSAAEEQLHDY